MNSKGYKVLPPKIGIIYGDGLDVEMIKIVLKVCDENKWAASNLVFGMGGGLLQKINRDTQKNAFKCSANQTLDGKWHDVFKDPIDGSKKSKAGMYIYRWMYGWDVCMYVWMSAWISIFIQTRVSPLSFITILHHC